MIDVVTGSQSVSGHNSDIFLLIGANASLNLTNNSGSSMYFTASNEYLNLGGNDSNESIFLYGNAHGISVTGALTGITDIYSSASTNDFLTLGSIAPAQIAISSDKHGGTLVTLSSGGSIDFVGDPRVSIVAAPHGTTSILGNF